MGSKIFSVEVRYRQCLHVSLAGKVKTGPLTGAGFFICFSPFYTGRNRPGLVQIII